MDISIIIPTYNRKFKLKACLDSLFAQTYAKDAFEIIVIDDGSIDGTKDMLDSLAKENANLRYFIQQHKGPAAARNLGIKHVAAQIIGFTDSDCVLDKDWVMQMVQAHGLERHTAAIGGSTEVDSHNIKAQVSQFLSDGAIEAQINGKSETIFFPTCNVSFKRNYLVSGFSELFPLPAGEDLDFFWRLFKKGSRFSYRKDIKVFHDCHTDMVSFLRQAYMYGRGNYLVQHLHKDHPLLKEIRVGNAVSFLWGFTINIIKISRFSYLLGGGLIRTNGITGIYKKFQIYIYFGLHKIMYLIGNFAEYRGIKNTDNNRVSPARPAFIILDITHRCNIKCNICEIHKDSLIREFTTQEIESLITQAIEWGVKEFVFSGGEPLIREDIFKILDFVREKVYRIGILSNGIIISHDFLNKLTPYLIDQTLSLTISLDSLTPAIHDDIRGAKGCFEKTTNALKLISRLKMSYPNINFNVIAIILNGNLEELLSLADFFKSLNVNSIQFQPLLANNLFMGERSDRVKYWIPRERFFALDKVIGKLIQFKRENPFLLRNSENNLRLVGKYFRGLLNPEEIHCQYAAKTMLIANNGDVTTCFDCYGNVRDKLLRDIFHSRFADQARKNVKKCPRPCLLPCFTDY